MTNASVSADLRIAAARFLAHNGAAEPIRQSEVDRFLDALGYGAADEADGGPVARVALLRAACALDVVFRLHSDVAPGLTFFGGVATAVSPAGAQASTSLNGAGETVRDAFQACIGEGVEFLSQFRRPGDVVRTGTVGGVAPWNDDRLARHLSDWLGEEKAAADIDWVPACRLSDGEPGWLPAAIVLREAGSDPAATTRFAPGCGCAAGPTWEAAAAAALREVVERDAVALWWNGCRPGRPIALETLVEIGAIETLARIRRGRRKRITTLLDISGDGELPCVAALSFDRSGGGFSAGFGCGFGTAPAAAAAAAIGELCQMELGHAVVAAKRRRLGADALNDADRRQEARSAGVSAAEPGLVDGLAGPISLFEAADGRAPRELAWALERLAAEGFTAYAADLTRSDLAIPVARVVVPGLQPYPSSFATPRLAAAVAGAKGLSPAARGIDLF